MQKREKEDWKRQNLELSNAMNDKEYEAADELFEDILSDLEKNYLPHTHLLKSAYKYALSLNKNRRRLNGDPNIMHDLAVAKILSEVGFESHLIAAAILHDTIYLNGIPLEELEHRFGSIVAETVNAVTRVSSTLELESDIEHRDFLFQSDVKFLKEIMEKNNRRAFYIKLADAIHNMRTIDALPEELQIKETKHVRNLLVPAAKKIHVFKLVETLESLCLKTENPIAFQTIQNEYKKMLDENQDGVNRIKAYWKKLVLPNKNIEQSDVADLFFAERHEDSIFRHLTSMVSNMNDLASYIKKKNIPLYDINFVVKDEYKGNPQEVFLKFYPNLYQSSYRITIIGYGYTSGTEAFFYKIKDRYGNQYRLFVQKKSELLRYSHGIMEDSMEDIRRQNVHINEIDPHEPERKQIQVYRKDGSAMLIEEGATVLDFAFALHRDIGICARYAYLNGIDTIVSLDTRLKEGDRVHVISDHFYKNEEKNIPHASIRWFRYVHTRKAIKDLVYWLEKNIDRTIPKIFVSDGKGIYSYEIEEGATVLDLAFRINPKTALQVEQAFFAKHHHPIELHRVLRMDDEIRFTYNDANIPKFSWFNIVKTKLARDTLIQYFEENNPITKMKKD